MSAETAHGRFRRRHGPSRLWPEGIASRVALILLLALFAAQAVSMVLYIRDRSDVAIRIFAQSAAQRIESTVALMETMPPPERQRLLPAIDSPTLRVRLGGPAAPELGPAWRPAPELAERVRRLLPSLRGRPLHVRALGRWREPADEELARGPVPDLLPSRRKIAIAVPLRDGDWLTFVVASDTTSVRWAARLAFWVAVSGAFILVFAFWAAHRVTRPLRLFAAAADRLGIDVAAPPLPERGSRELRRASRAFNRMQERLRRFIEDRTMMLAAVSHDLRTALTRLRLRAEYIADPEQQRKALADLDEMLAMLDASLAFARGESEAEARTRLDLAALLQSLCDDHADAGGAARYEGPDRCPFAGRPLALRRAFGNLIDNALKYGGEATVGLESAGDEIVVTVADRGPGIPIHLREQVFNPFYRVDSSRSRETGGNGLGLAVARSAVRRHGGDIFLEDRPGGGLVVRVTLPKATD